MTEFDTPGLNRTIKITNSGDKQVIKHINSQVVYCTIYTLLLLNICNIYNLTVHCMSHDHTVYWASVFNFQVLTFFVQYVNIYFNPHDGDKHL